MKIPAFALGLLVLGGAHPAFAAAGVKDGSFETPQLQSCCEQEFNSGDKLGSWTVIDGKVTLTSGNLTRNGFTFLAQDGLQWVNLAAGAKGAGGVQEKVKITQGTYTLGFYIGSVYDPTGKNGASSSVKLLIEGAVAGTYTMQADSKNKSTQQWKRFTVDISSGNDHITIGFAGADPKGDADCGVDDVTFKRKF